MRGDIELAGFVITQAEWTGMDWRQRAQLVRAATRRDEPWTAAAPPAPPARGRTAEADQRGRDAYDAYDAYEVTLAPA